MVRVVLENAIAKRGDDDITIHHYYVTGQPSYEP